MDVQGEKPVRNDAGELCLGDRSKQAAWKEHCECLSNVEFDWDRDSLAEVYPMEGLVPHIPLELVIKTIELMKCGKVAATSLIVDGMLKASGVEGAQQIRDLIEDVIHFGRTLTEFEESLIVSLYKGNGVALERENYRSLKLLDQVVKDIKRVAENFLKQKVRIDDLNFGFMSARITKDATVIVRPLKEKFHTINKTVCMSCVNLEKAFNHVPRRAIWWALRTLGIEEWLVRLIQNMCENARYRVRVGCNLSEEFNVKVGVHQDSCLSLLLFITNLEEFLTGCSVGKLMYRLPGHHYCITGVCMRSWSSGRLKWKERGFWSTWAKLRSSYLSWGSMCFRSPTKTSVPCVSRASAQILFSLVVVPVGSIRDPVVSLALWSRIPALGVNGVLDRPDQ